MAKLIGTDPNQVPTNADLGTMAYQDYDVVGPYLKGGRRNLIINGAMQVAQRGTSATSSDDSGYLAVDRFVYDTRVNGASSGDFTIEQVTDAPTGFQYSYKITNVDNTTVSSSGGVEFMQFIEGYDAAHLGWGTADAKGVTFSFWVKASYTGTQSVYFPSTNYGIVWLDSFTINSADTWEYKTFYIPGPTSGTWNTTTGRGIMARINLCNGSTAGTEKTWNQSNPVVSGQTQTFGTTTSSTFQITGVQLELGKVATPFEHRSYGEELALCQRYYQKHDLSPNSGKTLGQFHTSNQFVGPFEYPVTMRSIPTFTGISYGSGSNYVYSGGAYKGVPNTFNQDTINQSMVLLRVSGGSLSGTVGVAGVMYGLVFSLDAEL